MQKTPTTHISPKMKWIAQRWEHSYAAGRMGKKGFFCFFADFFVGGFVVWVENQRRKYGCSLEYGGPFSMHIPLSEIGDTIH